MSPYDVSKLSGAAPVRGTGREAAEAQGRQAALHPPHPWPISGMAVETGVSQRRRSARSMPTGWRRSAMRSEGRQLSHRARQDHRRHDRRANAAEFGPVSAAQTRAAIWPNNLRQMLAVLEGERQALAALDIDALVLSMQGEAGLCTRSKATCPTRSMPNAAPAAGRAAPERSQPQAAQPARRQCRRPARCADPFAGALCGPVGPAGVIWHASC